MGWQAAGTWLSSMASLFCWDSSSVIHIAAQFSSLVQPCAHEGGWGPRKRAVAPEASGDPGLNSGPHAGTHLVLLGASPLRSSEHFSPKQPVKKMRKNPRSRLRPSGSSNWWPPPLPPCSPCFWSFSMNTDQSTVMKKPCADCKPRPRWLLSRIK